jgi:ABC-type antimicrobial peptide transport system permease subunit
VVGDIQEVSLRSAPRQTIYVPQAQASTNLANALGKMPVFIARTGRTGPDITTTLTQELRRADPALARPQVFPLDELIRRSLARERFGATLFAGLAVLAVALTALGIHGVLEYWVQLRRRELGIRMAIGANARQVMRLVVRQGVAPVIVGLLLGLAASTALSQLVAAFVWGVTPTDPTTLTAVAALLLGVAVAAAWRPARKAAHLDPVETLSGE